MPLPNAWINRLFEKLIVRYGAAFMRQYGDLKPELVKDDWAEVLDGFDEIEGSIAFGLRYLPSDRPPNALEFRDICRRCPEPKPLAMIEGPPPSKPHPEIAAAMSRIGNVSDRGAMSNAEWCARQIRRLASIRGGKMSLAQREQVAACESICGDTSQPRPDGIAP